MPQKYQRLAVDSVASSSSTYGPDRVIGQAASSAYQETQPSDQGHGFTCPSRCGCGPYVNKDSLRRHLRKAHPALNLSLNQRLAAKAQTAKLKANDKLLKLQAKEAKEA